MTNESTSLSTLIASEDDPSSIFVAYPQAGSEGSLSMKDGTRLYSHVKSVARSAGIFERSRLYYALIVAVAFGGYAASTAGLIVFDGWLPLLVACLGFSAFTVQLAGIMHDCGHRAVFNAPRYNDVLGSLAAASIGMSLSGWRSHHNQHHAFPNQLEKDPDFEVPLTAFNPSQAARKGRITRALSPYQAFYFYFILATASLSNRLGGITYFWRCGMKSNKLELLGYLVAVTAMMAGPFLLFSIEKALFVFVTVHLTSGLYLANCFAPNHKGMKMLGAETGLSFFERQVVTARNIKGGLLAEVLMVGLNHQIEHHLFPNTPRNKLRRLKPLVMEACEQSGIPYGETSAVESSVTILRSLHQVSRA
jgi:fatty acid desaturase